MSLSSRLIARVARVRPAEAREVVVERDLETKMPDGTILLADRWFAPATADSDPVVLIRTPYGRRQLGIFGRLFSERGYQVLLQSCRGTFGSAGVFRPFHHEAGDGTATLEWIAAQPWCNGAVAMFGPSYMGLTQWAVAADPPTHLKALAMQVTTARVRDIVYPGGTFALETGANWVQQVHVQERPPGQVLLAMLAGRRRLDRAYSTLPLRDADSSALGVRVEFYQEWLEHDAPGDPWWDPVDWSEATGSTPPISSLAGWYDLFLPAQIADFRRLRDAGREARLTVGPWTHTSGRGAAAGFRDGLEWLDRHLLGRPSAASAPVRVFVTGSKRWVDLADWPPPHTVERWNLQPGGRLSVTLPGGGADRYTHDPADPAPGLGGPSLDPVRSGRREQSRRESRPDVLTYTSDPLPTGMTVAGPVNADIFVRSSRPSFDLFVRICDVNRRGRSFNVCDGIMRVNTGPASAPLDGVHRVRVALWPTAHTFRAGHRIRVQVSSAAHPLYARNPGSGEPLASAAELYPSDQEVFHDGERPSAIELPVSRIVDHAAPSLRAPG